MKVHLVDGTYELFRHFFAMPSQKDPQGVEIGAVRGVVQSMLGMIEGGATHVGVATDHVIESFRNELYPGYKTSEGVAPELLAQFPLLEEALRLLGVVVWPMVEYEADDALASAAACSAAAARASSASWSTIAQTRTPSASIASSSSGNCARRSGSTPAPVLYPGQSSLRNDSITWSVATPRWVAPSSRIVMMVPSTPRTAPTSSPRGSRCDGTAKK